MSGYKMIALDMDGTLLNTDKKITAENCLAIERAMDAGKEVVFSTGRSVSELKQYFELLPRVRYAVCVSGAFVYDAWGDRFLTEHPFSEEMCGAILNVARREDVMLQMLGRESVIQQDQLERMEEYHIEQYRELHRAVSAQVENSRDYYMEKRPMLGKINFYHRDTESRERSRWRLSVYPLSLYDAEDTGLECSPEGIHKGVGLRELCEHLDILPENVIAVGDSDNDTEVLKMVGLPIAMGNAREPVRKLCLEQVADCDHNGVAEAIGRFLI